MRRLLPFYFSSFSLKYMITLSPEANPLHWYGIERNFEQVQDHYTILGNCPSTPSPMPTLTLTFHQGKMLAQGRGRWAVSQKCNIHKEPISLIIKTDQSFINLRFLKFFRPLVQLIIKKQGWFMDWVHESVQIDQRSMFCIRPKKNTKKEPGQYSAILTEEA